MKPWLRLMFITMTVGGGFAGLAVTSQVLVSGQIKGLIFVFMGAVFTLLYLFVLIAGLLFVHDAQRTTPLAIALAIQIPVLSSPILAYRFGAGLIVDVGLSPAGPFWWIRLGADWQFFLISPLPVGLGVNLVAVILMAMLGSAIRREENAAQAVAMDRNRPGTEV